MNTRWKIVTNPGDILGYGARVYNQHHLRWFQHNGIRRYANQSYQNSFGRSEDMAVRHAADVQPMQPCWRTG